MTRVLMEVADGRDQEVPVEQILGKLREAEKLQRRGRRSRRCARKLGVSEQTFYRWRIEYGALREGSRRQAAQRRTPPTHVSLTRIAPMPSGSTPIRSPSSTVKSARKPGARRPFTPSSPDEAADPTV